MTSTYDPKITALLCIDFYNDFLSVGGKLWPWVKDIAEEVNLLDNLRTDRGYRPRGGGQGLSRSASSLGAGRLCGLEVSVSLPARGGRAAGLCERHVGRDVPQRLPGAAGRHRCNRALGIERFSERLVRLRPVLVAQLEAGPLRVARIAHPDLAVRMQPPPRVAGTAVQRARWRRRVSAALQLGWMPPFPAGDVNKARVEQMQRVQHAREPLEYGPDRP